MKRLAVLAVGLLSAFVIACGDSGSESDPVQATSAPAEEVAPMSKGEFVAQADQICRSAGKALDRLEKQGDVATQATDYEGLAVVYEGFADQGTGMVEEMRALGYEGQDSETVDAYLETLEKQMEKVRQLTGAVRDVDWGAISSMGVEIESLNDKGERLAKELGLEDCVFAD